MVRFSDMLGGSGEPDDAGAAESPYAALAGDATDAAADAELEADAENPAEAPKEPVPMATFETPEAVLDRLKQYATTARTTEHAAPLVPEVEETQAEPTGWEAQPKSTNRQEANESEPEIATVTETEPETVTDTGTEPESESEPLWPVGDDFLPDARSVVRRAGRGRKRHP